MKTGLVLGKFAPFHRGHELLIKTALEEVDKLYVLVYDTSLTPVPLSVRARWIKTVFPATEVISGWNGPEDAGRDPAIERLQEKYIIKMLDGRKIDVFFSGEYYGAHVSSALGAEDRRVDEARATVPVSGTLLRENPYLYRHLVDPAVYRDLVARVVFLGAMSTGKTTLAKALAHDFKTAWMPEYGREYWEIHQSERRLTLADLENIVRIHLEKEEEAVLSADRYLFVDTCAITTYTFSLDYHGRATGYICEKARENQSRYDLFYLCGTDIPYEDTWDRSGPQKREDFQKMIEADLLERRIPFIRLSGTLAQRIAKVKSDLADFKKYGNYFGDIVPRRNG